MLTFKLYISRLLSSTKNNLRMMNSIILNHIIPNSHCELQLIMKIILCRNQHHRIQWIINKNRNINRAINENVCLDNVSHDLIDNIYLELMFYE